MMRTFECDRCHKEVKSYGDLQNYNIDTGAYNFFNQDIGSPPNFDLCKECSIELDDLKQKIIRDNKVQLQAWFRDYKK